MPFISTEEVKRKRQILKKEFPNLKLSVRRTHRFVLTVAIMEGDLDFDDEYQSVNPFYIQENFASQPKERNVLQRIYDIINEHNYQVVNDGDYGSIPQFYIDITIGKCDRAYKKR